jgi:hypothetical protein
MSAGAVDVINSQAVEVLDRIWEQYGNKDRWVFATTGLKNGDLYISLTSFPAFRARHALHTPVDLLCVAERHRKIALLFEHAFDNIYLVPDLERIRPIDVQYWCLTRGFDNFAPGNLIYLQPLIMTHRQFEIYPLIDINWVGYIDCCRMMLRVPLRTAPAPPKVTDDQRRRAAALAEKAGVVPGGSIILFPYAESVEQDAVRHFTKFAAHAMQSGMRVLTSVAREEVAIEGSSPIFIPFDLLLPFAELAGNVLIIRSGIADILASANCRKLLIYRHEHQLRAASIIDMGIGNSAVERVFLMSERSVEEFVQLASRVFLPGENPIRDNEIPFFVADFFAQQSANYDDSVAAMSTDISNKSALFDVKRFRALRGVVLADGWSALESWGVWSDGTQATLFVRNPFARCLGQVVKTYLVTITLGAKAAISPQHPILGIGITIGGKTTEFVISWPLPQAELTLTVPAELVFDGEWRLVIDIDSPSSPHEQSGGVSPDRRRLGIGLRSVQVARRVREPI